MNLLESLVQILTEAPMSAEEREDADLLRSISAKLDRRPNSARLNKREQDVLDKYGIDTSDLRYVRSSELDNDISPNFNVTDAIVKRKERRNRFDVKYDPGFADYARQAEGKPIPNELIASRMGLGKDSIGKPATQTDMERLTNDFISRGNSPYKAARREMEQELDYKRRIMASHKRHMDNIKYNLNRELGKANESLEEDCYTCCICGGEFDDYGNNPYPYEDEGRCCNECNLKYVIPARLRMMKNK